MHIYYSIKGHIHFGASSLTNKLYFCWQKMALDGAWYKVLSVLHMMVMLRLSQANSLLLTKTLRVPRQNYLKVLISAMYDQAH